MAARLCALASTFLLAALTCADAASCAVPDAPQLVFADEFVGPSGARPDPARWMADTGARGRGQLQYYTAGSNAYLDGLGNLVLVARREATPGALCPAPAPTAVAPAVPLPPAAPVTPAACAYTSARLSTTGRAWFQYGRFVARIMVPAGVGLWSAFWLAAAPPAARRDPRRCAEIDIMEQLGRRPHRVYATAHGPNYCGTEGIGASHALRPPPAASFHTYGLTWSPQELAFDVDGVVYHTVRRADVERYYGPWAFDSSYALVLNLSVGGDWPGPPDPALPFPREMVVDYVRVYATGVAAR